MPLQDVGYRPWNKKRCGPSTTIWVIALTGIRLAWESRWLRRMVFFAWSPALIFAASFFAFEQAVDEGRLTSLGTAAQRGRNLDGVGMLGTVLADALGGNDGDVDVQTTRHLVWTRLLLAFMRAPQAMLLAAVLGLVAPTLISRDLRAKAWLIYFTRPVGRAEYILGKSLILFLLVLVITMLPALALWFTGVLVSPSVSVAFETWDLPIRIIAASLILAIPTVFLALAYSSLTAESRIASFAWFATWVACWIAHGALTTADLVASTQDGGVSTVLSATKADQASRSSKIEVSPLRRNFRWFARAAGIDTGQDRWAWVSPYHALGAVQAAIFGIDTRPSSWWPSSMTLLLISVSSLVILSWRITAPASS
ncbi:MAG: ABC transporter permease subunit [Planctomycetaceae bacterium]|nr:ABC transporter permease subunit [Planctomycetaceae bacterium]MBT4158718.1 ABC transporter permease subunit [Planctomycetaceae bacterium]MBT4886289.1 ABC transporter permease subunit [Planctomycetaceae bacterium]MBT6054643.1 ABC transporter permease subunit [Planctomycetaceae bacterium]MBT6460857.1 ABC transporter permease subunit [Planctomycetaceae bacterium]